MLRGAEALRVDLVEVLGPGRPRREPPVLGGELEQALEIEVYNSRGVTMRSPTAGGGQERGLMERYLGYASAVNDGWPRTARMLRRIAHTYRHDARREDDIAALTKDFWR